MMGIVISAIAVGSLPLWGGLVGLLSLLLLWLYFRYVVRPRRIVESGMDLLAAQDFNSRLKKVGQKDADRIIDIFNRLLTQLRNERLHVRDQNHFLDLLVEASPMGVVQMDFDGRITSLNPAAKRILENDALAKHIDTMKNGEVCTLRLNDSHIYRISRKTFTDHGYAHPFVLIETMTDEVMRAEKKAYEKVIRMISHEVNNTVAGVTSSMESISEALSDQSDIHDLLSVCIERSYAMSRFITRFADVVKIPEPRLQPMDVCAHLDQCLLSMESLCQHITIHRNYSSFPTSSGSVGCGSAAAPPSLTIHADPILMDQVFVNIIKNAIESIEGEGNIFINVCPGMIEIADDGQPIPPDVEQHLFTPFYSSKPNGQGIGLVLIREVLTRHGFRFSLKTDGPLTRFRIQPLLS